jgi:ribonuclease Z
MKIRTVCTFGAGFLACFIVLALLVWTSDRGADLLATSAEASGEVGSAWSPTKPNPSHTVYFPGTEELAPDEMRVIACGSGMPMPRLKQAAACFLIVLPDRAGQR